MPGEQILTYRPLPGARLNMAHPLTKGLVGCWLLNESGGYRAMDLSPYGNHGKLVGFASPPPRPFNGLPFNGASNKVTIPDSSILTFGNSLTDSPFSIELWLCPTSLAANSCLLAKATAAVVGEYYFSGGTGGDAIFRCVDNSAGARIGRTTGSAVLTLNVWVHLIATYDGSGVDTGIKIYSGSIEQTTAASSDGVYVAMEDTTLNLELGVRGASPWWTGLIALARIYKYRTLSKDDIKWLYQEPYDMFLR